MDTISQYDLYREIYYKELEGQEKLLARIQFSATLLLAELTLLGLLLDSIAASDCPEMSLLFGIGTLVVLLCFAAYNWVRAFWGNTYEILPLAADTMAYRDELEHFYSEHAEETKAKKLAEFYFVEYLKTNFVKCATTNSQSNIKRNLHIHASNRWMLIFFFTGASFYTFLNYYYAGAHCGFIV